jgi:diguanylate cyclase (GGDEF)-like protein
VDAGEVQFTQLVTQRINESGRYDYYVNNFDTTRQLSQPERTDSPPVQQGELDPIVPNSTGPGSREMSTEWGLARARSARTIYASAIVGVFVAGVIDVLAAYIGDQRMTGVSRYFVIGAWFMLLMAPVVFALSRHSIKAQRKSDDIVETLASQLTDAARIADAEAVQREVQARRQRFESRLANALDMAAGEAEVVNVTERAFQALLPNAPVELLLGDNSHAHLIRVASSSPTGVPPGCSIDSPDHCPASRRAQVQRFDDSEELDACPWLRGRAEGALSAVCVPVSIMGRSVGVIHTTGARRAPVDEDTVQSLETLAKLAGTRIGVVRVMAETQLQAATDTLTGLLNRRSFEERAVAQRRKSNAMAIVMADLDHFKELNDTYGHETGDRALRLFAQVLRESVRNEDLVSRHGGEEFVVALAGCGSNQAIGVLRDFQARLESSIIVAGLPAFTASFGVVEIKEREDLPTAIARADAALFDAKHQGRNRAVVHDGNGVEEATDGAVPASRSRGTEASSPISADRVS